MIAQNNRRARPYEAHRTGRSKAVGRALQIAMHLLAAEIPDFGIRAVDGV